MKLFKNYTQQFCVGKTYIKEANEWEENASVLVINQKLNYGKNVLHLSSHFYISKD